MKQKSGNFVQHKHTHTHTHTPVAEGMDGYGNNWD